MGDRLRSRELTRQTLEQRRAEKDRSRQPPRPTERPVRPPSEKQIAVLLEVRRTGGSPRSIRDIALAAGVACPTVDNCFRRGWLEDVNHPRPTHAGHEVVRQRLMGGSGERPQTSERPRSFD